MTGSEPERWVDRRFAFDVPPERHPVLRCRLAGASVRLEELTRNLSVAALTTRVDGKWSIQENAGHLYDLEAVADARLDDYLSGAAVLTHADTSNPATERACYNRTAAGGRARGVSRCPPGVGGAAGCARFGDVRARSGAPATWPGYAVGRLHWLHRRPRRPPLRAPFVSCAGCSPSCRRAGDGRGLSCRFGQVERQQLTAT